MGKCKVSCVFAALLLSSSSTYAGTTKCHDILQQPGRRVYENKQGWIIYEGSLYKDLIDLSRKLGMKGIEPELGHDVYLHKRLFTKTRKATDIAATINAELYGVKVTVKDRLFWISPKNTKVTEHRSQGCRTYSFEVKNESLVETLNKFSKFSGWNVDTSNLSPWQKGLIMKARVITGKDYYDILGKLLTNTDLGIKIYD